MTEKIKRFIEENIELIENDNWEEVYRGIYSKLYPDNNVGKFTEIMLAVDIHPEYYLRKLPDFFLNGSSISEFVIPSNITSIGCYAFYKCSNLTSVVIPDSVTLINIHAFEYCTSLTSMVIPGSVTMICSNSFTEGMNLNIKFTGTKVQWKNIAKGKFSGVTYTCNCIDGVLKKSR